MGRKAESIMPKGDMRRIEEEIGFDEEYRDPSSEGMSPNGGQYPMMMNGEESHRMPGMYDPNGVEQNDHLRMIRGGDFENNRRPDRMPPMHDGEPFPSDQFAPHPQGGFYPQPPYRERELGDWMQDFMSKCRSEGKSNEECKSATDENMRGERPDEYIPLMDPFEMCVREGMPLEYCEERRWEYEQ